MKNYVAILMSLTPLVTMAVEQSDNIKTTAKINNACLLSMSNINLGTLSDLPKDIKTVLKEEQVVVKCNKDTAYTITTDNPGLTINPIDNKTVFQYIYRMDHITNPTERDFIGYRFRISDSKVLGDGNISPSGVQTSTIINVGNGNTQHIPLYIEYYTYFSIKSGDYAASHTLKITY